MVLNCTLSKKVKERVAEFVRNKWSLAAERSEVVEAFARRDEIQATAAVENRCCTVEEELELIEIRKTYVAIKRGLSQVHYDQWRNARLGLSKVKRANYDAGLIRDGRLLDAGGVLEYAKKNRFQKEAAKAVG